MPVHRKARPCPLRTPRPSRRATRLSRLRTTACAGVPHGMPEPPQNTARVPAHHKGMPERLRTSRPSRYATKACPSCRGTPTIHPRTKAPAVDGVWGAANLDDISRAVVGCNAAGLPAGADFAKVWLTSWCGLAEVGGQLVRVRRGGPPAGAGSPRWSACRCGLAEVGGLPVRARRSGRPAGASSQKWSACRCELAEVVGQLTRARKVGRPSDASSQMWAANWCGLHQVVGQGGAGFAEGFDASQGLQGLRGVCKACEAWGRSAGDVGSGRGGGGVRSRGSPGQTLGS